MWDDLRNRIESFGWRACLVSVSHLPELRREIAERLESGELSGEFHTERLAWFHYHADGLESACSIIVVAIPRPQARVRFHHEERSFPAVIPPTYAEERELAADACARLTELLAVSGHKVVPTRLPLKLLAVRSGLAEYGRNNITYVRGFGSFHQLAAFYSDLPPQADTWQPARVMDACSVCQLCAWSCPTGAILEDRFLIAAERCLVFLNERLEPFPKWVKTEWHTCPIGCLECQNCCPEDVTALERVEDLGEFDEAETRALLHGISEDDLDPVLREKLRRTGLLDYLQTMPRNLSALFASMRLRATV
jgi:epoxyqueuosine reductase